MGMKKLLHLKPILNKKNGQINLSLPRRKIPKELADNIKDIKEVAIEIWKWE